MDCNTVSHASIPKAGEKHTQVEKKVYPFTSCLLHSVYSKHSHKVFRLEPHITGETPDVRTQKTQEVSLSMLQETFQHGWSADSGAAEGYIQTGSITVVPILAYNTLNCVKTGKIWHGFFKSVHSVFLQHTRLKHEGMKQSHVSYIPDSFSNTVQ